MSYYVRAFCTSGRPPDLRSIQGWLAERGSPAVLDDPDHAVAVSSGGASGPPTLALAAPEWQQIALSYDRERLPILAECDPDDGTAECLCRQEVGEFVALVQELPPSPARDTVLDQLRATRFIVACRLPMSDFQDAGYDANDEFLAYFVEHCGGMLQADGEGFYDRARLLLPLS